MLRIEQFDEVHCKLKGDRGYLLEISEFFTFYAENYKFSPKYRERIWDGKIRLLNVSNGLIYKGLIPMIIQFCENKKIGIELDDNLFSDEELIDEDFVYKFYKKIEGPFIPHDEQVEAFVDCINSKRNISILPTSNGKSYLLYGLSRYYIEKKKRILIVAHRAGLVDQLIEDNFKNEYDKNKNSFTSHTIFSGKEKNSKAQIVASTWQSIKNKQPKWFEQFDVIMADEVHRWDAKICASLLKKCKKIKYRHGFTGTIKDIETHKLTLEGLFGPAKRLATTKQLIDKGIVARPKINAILLNYPERFNRMIAKNKVDWKDEFSIISESKKRLKFLGRLIETLDGNIIVAFRNREHGNAIYQCFTNKERFYIDGSISVERRSEYQKWMGTGNNIVGVVSMGTFSEGINIPRINHVIIAAPMKSEIQVPQLIGRGLRLAEGKDTVKIHDIIDNMKYKKRDNYALKHGKQRLALYEREEFEVEYHSYDLK